MAKELPYFRFTVQEWQNGLIGIENYHLKGLFIDVCSYYWVQDCNVDYNTLRKKFHSSKIELKKLVDLKIIKLQKNEKVKILFLDEQLKMLSKARKLKQLAGSKGGKKKSSNAKAQLEHNSSYKDKDKDNDNNKDKDRENIEHFNTGRIDINGKRI
jgi:hypothetical protein